MHDILKYVLSRVTVSLYLNMFGYDDKELNDILMAKALDSKVTMLITLDKSQTGTKTEAALLPADKAHNLSAFNTHFVVGNSSTGQISHTKGFVADGRVAAEGSTNWSISGEGVFVLTGTPGGPGYKAQNNTQSVITDQDTVTRFAAELIAEHMAAQHASLDNPQKASSMKSPLPAKFAPQNPAGGNSLGLIMPRSRKTARIEARRPDARATFAFRPGAKHPTGRGSTKIGANLGSVSYVCVRICNE